MKLIILIALLPLLAAFNYNRSSNANYNEYDALAQQIKTQIEQYAISSGKTKVSGIEIWENGEIKLFYSGSSQPEMFNIYQLIKSYENYLGIALNENETFIRFYISEASHADIHFRTHEKAKEVYDAFIDLLMSGKDYYSPEINLDISNTIDSINYLLAKYSDYKPQIKVSLKGTVIITDAFKQFFTFNLQDLASSDSYQGFEVNGIEMIPCCNRTVAPNSQIVFNTGKRTAAFIKMSCISDAELNNLHQLIVHLRSTAMRVMYS